MKAIVQDRYGTADVLEFRDIGKPVADGDEDVLVRVHAAGVDAGAWHLMTGLPYPVRLMGFGLRRPKHPVRGWDFAGTVEAVGGRVTRFRPGDEVFGTSDGSWAEYTCTRADRIAPKPPGVTFEQAAVLPASGCTALQALRDAGKVRQGQQILVIGAGGGVGTYAVQLAKNVYGATVTGVCGGPAKAELVRSLGADHVIDYTREDFTEAGRRYDLILDTAGNRPLSRLRRALAPRGTVVLVGGEEGGKLLGGMQRNLAGAVLSLFGGQNFRGLMAAAAPEDLQFLAERTAVGEIAPVITRTYPLSDAADAVRHWERGHMRGKLVITVQ
ncbi:NAD(P)-dependent alcohol dehydrogenase [Streptomyces poriticola]|uniref:NAD(P)-dependent alcohol dehydrogenase n=1 Tax=Streptomyces poriticola TaxID=3120506 RepID=UPI002FCE1551